MGGGLGGEGHLDGLDGWMDGWMRVSYWSFRVYEREKVVVVLLIIFGEGALAERRREWKWLRLNAKVQPYSTISTALGV